MSISSFYPYQLQKEEHFQFMSDVSTLVETYQAAVLGIDAQYAVFQQKFEIEGNNLQQERGSLMSGSIAEADALRDRTWTAVRMRISASENSPFQEERNSAVALRYVMDLYGNMREKKYSSESAALSNLTADLQRVENAGHMAVLGIADWVTELEKQNTNFIDLLNQRNKKYAEQAYGDTKEIRNAVDSAYGDMVERINAYLLLGMAAEPVTPFVNELNEKIKYYKRIISSHSAGQEVSSWHVRLLFRMLTSF